MLEYVVHITLQSNEKFFSFRKTPFFFHSPHGNYGIVIIYFLYDDDYFIRIFISSFFLRLGIDP